MVRSMVQKDLVDDVIDVKQVYPKVIPLEIVVNEKIFCIISVYCPQSGRNDEENQFYNELSNSKKWRVYNKYEKFQWAFGKLIGFA